MSRSVSCFGTVTSTPLSSATCASGPTPTPTSARPVLPAAVPAPVPAPVPAAISSPAPLSRVCRQASLLESRRRRATTAATRHAARAARVGASSPFRSRPVRLALLPLPHLLTERARPTVVRLAACDLTRHLVEDNPLAELVQIRVPVVARCAAPGEQPLHIHEQILDGLCQLLVRRTTG